MAFTYFSKCLAAGFRTGNDHFAPLGLIESLALPASGGYYIAGGILKRGENEIFLKMSGFAFYQTVMSRGSRT